MSDEEATTDLEASDPEGSGGLPPAGRVGQPRAPAPPTIGDELTRVDNGATLVDVGSLRRARPVNVTTNRALRPTILPRDSSRGAE